MGQISLYLDDRTQNLLRKAARESGVSQSKWVSELVRARLSREWSPGVRRLAGAWSDALETEDLRAGLPPDLPREPL